MSKRTRRNKRAKKTRAKIKSLGMPRLSVNRTLQHIYAQIIMPEGGKVVAVASTLDKKLKEQNKDLGRNIAAAEKIGEAIALRAKAAGISKVAFDRSGFRYHGIIKALADAARNNGLEF